MRVLRLGGIAVLLLAAQCALVCAKVTLDLKDNLILPGSKWGAGDGEANAILGDLVFINGEAGKLVVVNTKDYKSTVTDSYELGSTGTSVATCSTGDENLVAAGSLGKDGKKGAGEVAIFSVDIKTGKLTFKRQISTVGSLPDHIIWAKNCRVIVAAIEGEAVPTGTTIVNPEGGIAVAKFRAASAGNVADDAAVSFKFVTFADQGFNDPKKRDPLLQAGVRWSLRPETIKAGFYDSKSEISIPESEATFSKDLEPEYLALSKDGDTVYVGLQEACAIAVFKIDSMTIASIHALKPKDWAKTSKGLDASNKDKKINMKKWPVYGMLMPDTIQVYTAANGKEYLVTANEGDDKEYIWGDETALWTEMIRGADIAKEVGKVSEDNEVKQDDLDDEKKLGRIKIGLFDGRTLKDGKFGPHDKIYTMGGRSFSIIDTTSWKTVYDSGSAMEEVLAEYYEKMFNSEASDNGDESQEEAVDGRSDDKGLEVESLAIAQFCGKSYAFIGAERTSHIFAYDITSPKDSSMESHFFAGLDGSVAPMDARASNTSKTTYGFTDPESMNYDSKRQVLVVSGALSGNLGVFKVEGLDHKCSNAPQLAEGLVYGAFAILLIFVLAVFFAGECRKPQAPTEMVDGAKFGHEAPAATLGHAYNV